MIISRLDKIAERPMDIAGTERGLSDFRAHETRPWSYKENRSVRSAGRSPSSQIATQRPRSIHGPALCHTALPPRQPPGVGRSCPARMPGLAAAAYSAFAEVSEVWAMCDGVVAAVRAALVGAGAEHTPTMRPPVRVDHGKRTVTWPASMPGPASPGIHPGAPANSTTPSPPAAGQSLMVRSEPPVSTVPSAAKATA